MVLLGLRDHVTAWDGSSLLRPQDPPWGLGAGLELQGHLCCQNREDEVSIWVPEPCRGQARGRARPVPCGWERQRVCSCLESQPPAGERTMDEV